MDPPLPVQFSSAQLGPAQPSPRLSDRNSYPHYPLRPTYLPTYLHYPPPFSPARVLFFSKGKIWQFDVQPSPWRWTGQYDRGTGDYDPPTTNYEGGCGCGGGVWGLGFGGGGICDRNTASRGTDTDGTDPLPQGYRHQSSRQNLESC